MTATAASTGGVTRHRSAIMMVTMIAASIYSLNLTIVSISLPHMQGTFSATPDQIAWVVTAFIVGMTTMIVCTGWLSARFGRKRLFTLSLIIFTMASLMCGNVHTLEGEVMWRFLQGVAGASIIPLSQAIAVSAYPADQQGKAIGVWGIGNMIGPIIAPPIGGYLTELYGWPTVFYINLPLGLLAVVGAILFVPHSEPDRSRRFDIVGFAVLVVSVVSLQLMLNRGTRLDWFDATEIIVEAALAALFFYIFLVHAFTARNPILRPEMFMDRNYAGCLLVAFGFGIQVFLPTILLPLMLKNLRGYPIEMIGLLLAPRAVGVLAGNLVAGFLTSRFQPKHLVVIGFIGVSASAWFMSRWTLDVGPWDVAWTGIMQGFFSSLIFVPVASHAFSTLSLRYREEAIPVFYLVLNLGGSLGIAGIITYWTSSTQHNHAVLSEHISIFNPLYRLLPGAWNPERGASAAVLDVEIMRQASMIAYNNCFTMIMLVTLLSAPAALLMRRRERK